MNKRARLRIEEIITEMMERVIEKVTTVDPFIPEEHHAKKPLYAALVPDTIFKGAHFERRFVTPFGDVWQRLSAVVAEETHGKSALEYEIRGSIQKERLRRIQEVLDNLEHGRDAKGKRIKPNWAQEFDYIKSGRGELLPITVICDLYVSNLETKKNYAIEIKAPLPNSDQTKVSKEKLFKLLLMEPKPVDAAYYALPYNPYGRKEDYGWSFPKRWFNMINDACVLIGEELWDFLGGKGTYSSFIDIISDIGRKYHQRIYTEYLGLRMPDDYQYFKLK